ncbi:MAG TPA: right-handed parallel beta-helix repeat-containing protein [Candidatus Acidoferrum sp.]|nr:right-handed parallel beta-helix repeat-containing protein [Candidatus Acidoferrum sp.]
MKNRRIFFRRAACCLLWPALWLAGPGWGQARGEGTPPGVVFDLQRFIDSELAAGKQRIVVPPGRYRVTPHDRQHLVLRHLKDVTIVADGVEMICTETTRALTIADCTNLTLRGLVIDYDPLPFTQGRITAFASDKQVQEIELFDGYPAAETARNFKYEIFRPDTRTLRCADRDVQRIEAVDARHLRIFAPREHADSPEQIGDLIVIGAEDAPHGSVAHAVECSHNVNVRLEEIDLYASNCFGFMESDCDGSVYDRCRISRRAPAEDIAKRADPRLRSLDADAFHSNGAIKGPAYLECAAQFMGDDCINIHGDYHLITHSEGAKLRVLAKGAMNIRPGDPVELVLYNGQRLPDAKAVAVEAAGTILDEERAFLSRQNMDAGLKSGRSLRNACAITLDREADLPMGSLICAANRVGNGFSVKGCDFGFNRSRGILIKASHGEVSGNHLEGCQMSAILVTPEYWWLEAGSSSAVLISGNRIRDCGGVAICVEAEGGNGRIAPAGAHRDITITGNTVEGCAMPGILVTSTAGLRLENNTLNLRSDAISLPAQMRQAGLKVLTPVVQIQCQP